jgi:divalent metal cation (Fe/Co/Zn/Cd) transporter
VTLPVRSKDEMEDGVSLPAPCSCPAHANIGASAERQQALARAMRLEYATIAWNFVEGVVAVGAAIAAGSIALLGFGVDSIVEMASGMAVLWRLRAEARHREPIDVEKLDQGALRLVGLSLVVLAAYIAFEAIHALLGHKEARPTFLGLAVTAVSLPVMLWLGRAKRRAAHRMASRALESDAFQTTACMWLSLITLAGVGLNAAFGWAWADPTAALGMTYLLGREGWRAWHGRTCTC